MRVALDLCETDLTPRLENWGRWQRVHLPYSQCDSLEGNYRSPQYGHWERVVHASRTHYDSLDAAQIEDAVSTIDLLLHALLGLFYVRCAPPAVAVRLAYRAAREKPPRYPEFGLMMVKAEDELARALELPAVVRMRWRRAFVRRILLNDLTEEQTLA